jgi:membrane-bound metal-dependent hydrolase YbcI (DUF457 family)
MFIGHFAVGFAAKRFAPRASLAVLLLAPLLADVLWPFFLLLGWEHARIEPGATRVSALDLYDFTLSHSLLGLMVSATLFAVIYWSITRYTAGAAVIWVGVMSHWVLDWVTHRPDMPLYPGSPKYGLGLWNSIAGTIAVELSMFAIGVWLYVRATWPRDRIGRNGFEVNVFLLLVLYVTNFFSGPPPSIRTVIATSLLLEPVFLIWAWWFDKHREPRAGFAG